MLKIVYPICCGIDVHKKFVIATIATTNDKNVTSYQTRRFNTFKNDLIALNNWLVENKCKDVCMESTGKYWIPVFNVLEDFCTITLANPRYVKNIPGKKTDKRDSIWLADLHKHALVKGSFIPSKPIRELRDLIRYKSKLTNVSSSEKNRVQNSLTVSNIMLANVVSDTFGKSASSIIKHMIENPDIIDFDYSSMLHKSLKKKSDEIEQAVAGKFSKEQAAKLSVCYEHYNSVEKCIEILEATILELSLPFKEQIDIIATLPGIKQASATAILSEIGTDMSVFTSDKHLCSWAGLTPQSNESAGKKKSVRISRAGVYIKPLLVQCANAAVKDKSCTVFKNRYETIKKRRGHKRAIIATARMILTCIYHMLSKNEPFNPLLYDDNAKSKKRNQQDSLSIEQAIAFLQANGYTVNISDLVAITN
ncbi:IS110 family transposase [Clostridium thermosuccinogenes]|uniref:IS110 family transposase n=1 Tax=Clostridium thermosuccinogenes TaxID=84032 RepID=UPI000CA11231|nr:IS110 family transposase [Pseudoclostridium thermosuccinogenes]AUS97322.1 IS110 family transposase [Pseudoclostridium thermosuccinogenes]